MSQELEGKVAVVTGAADGLGRLHALQLASMGAAVVVNDVGTTLGGEGRDESKARAVVEEIEKAGGQAAAHFGDVSSWDDAQALIRTAFSTTVREAGDLSAGVFDLKGRMLAQAVTGTPGHVNAMAASVGHFLERFPPGEMAEGDAYVTNDPWLGTGHLFDFTVVSPAFHQGRLVALFATTVHVVDIGGSGFGPDAES